MSVYSVQNISNLQGLISWWYLVLNMNSTDMTRHKYLQLDWGISKDIYDIFTNHPMITQIIETTRLMLYNQDKHYI
jgi:hypothetical protein